MTATAKKTPAKKSPAAPPRVKAPKQHRPNKQEQYLAGVAQEYIERYFMLKAANGEMTPRNAFTAITATGQQINADLTRMSETV